MLRRSSARETRSVAPLAINLRRRTSRIYDKELRSATEMCMRLFSTLLFLKNEESLDNKSVRKQTPQLLTWNPQKEVGIPQKDVFIFNL